LQAPKAQGLIFILAWQSEIAALMTRIRRDWPNFGGLVTALVVALVLRFVGLWIYARAKEREQFEAFRTAQPETLASN
jgi:NhaP-type Na+/H+ or K+/H+ antiporter